MPWAVAAAASAATAASNATRRRRRETICTYRDMPDLAPKNKRRAHNRDEKPGERERDAVERGREMAHEGGAGQHADADADEPRNGDPTPRFSHVQADRESRCE